MPQFWKSPVRRRRDRVRRLVREKPGLGVGGSANPAIGSRSTTFEIACEKTAGFGVFTGAAGIFGGCPIDWTNGAGSAADKYAACFQ